jgi:hypothetical protein
MFVSDVNIQPNRAGLPGIASLESIVGARSHSGSLQPGSTGESRLKLPSGGSGSWAQRRW